MELILWPSFVAFHRLFCSYTRLNLLVPRSRSTMTHSQSLASIIIGPCIWNVLSLHNSFWQHLCLSLSLFLKTFSRGPARCECFWIFILVQGQYKGCFINVWTQYSHGRHGSLQYNVPANRTHLLFLIIYSTLGTSTALSVSIKLMFLKIMGYRFMGEGVD